jgi:ATP-dependent RNA helicase DOB1
MVLIVFEDTDIGLLDLRELEDKKDGMVIQDEEKVADYFNIRAQLTELRADFREVITHPSYSLPFLQVGRLVKVRYKEHNFGWGVVVNYQKRSTPKVSFPTTG